MTDASAPDNIAKRVIDAFKGPTKLSRALSDIGEPTPIATVHAWGTKGRIPRWHRRPIIEAAKAAEVSLPQEFLTSEAA